MFNLYPKDVVAINKIVFKYFFGDDFEDDEELDLDFKDEKSEDTNNFLYKLRKPFVSGNKTITELKLDFDSLTYLDYKKCESQVRRMAENSFNIIPSENENFQLCFAAMASGFEVEEFIKKLSIADYLVVCMKVIDFLTDTESEEEEMQTENTQESQTISNE